MAFLFCVAVAGNIRSAALPQEAALHLPFPATSPLVKMRLERSAERDKREIINNSSAIDVQSAAEHILNRPACQSKEPPYNTMHGGSSYNI